MKDNKAEVLEQHTHSSRRGLKLEGGGGLSWRRWRT